MPPAISDDDMSDADSGVRSDIVSKKPKKSYKEVAEDEFDESEPEVKPVKRANGNGKKAAAVKEEVEEEDEEDEDEDMDEDEYVVEKILAHLVDEAGNFQFQVKWEGYEEEKDLTWEEEDNLKENAAEVLQEYFRRKGGRDMLFTQTEKALKSRKRVRQSNSATPAETTKRSKKNAAHPLDTTPPASAKAAQWQPPSGTWEDHVETVDMCQDEANGSFIVYLTWKNGMKTQHPKEVVYRRCPQKMLRFYERHIRISKDGGEPVPIASVTN